MNMNGIKKISIVDDHEVTAFGLKSIIETEPNWKVSVILKNGNSFIQFMNIESCDLAIVDYMLPDMTGLDVMKTIRQKIPNQKFLLISSIRDEKLKQQLIDMNIEGYLFKSESSNQIYHCIQTIFNQGTYYSLFEPDVSPNKGLGPFQSLTKRELEIAIYTSKGYSQKEISEKLTISIKTVEVHKYNLINKLGKISDIELAKLAISWNLIKDDTLISIHKI